MKEIKKLSELVQEAYNEKISGKTSPELMVYKSSGMNETTAADGGYCVTAQIGSEILTATLQKSLCYSKAKIIPVSKGKSVKIPYTLDSNSASEVITAYWPGEGVAKTVSHPTYGQHDLPLNTLAVFTPITEELMDDVQQLEGYLKNLVPIKIGQEIDAKMIHGDPASSMWGITSAGAVGVIGVANNDPITLANLVSYEKALAPASKANAEWYMGTEQYNELLDLIDDTKTNTSFVWEKDGLYIMGHKVNVCNFLKKNQYDLILGDFNDYIVVERSLESTISLSFKFNLDEKVIRWTIRINGASFGNKVTLEDGSVVAPFVIPAEGPVELSSSSSSVTGVSNSSASSLSNSSDSSVSNSTDSTESLSTESLRSGSSDSSESTSSVSTSSSSSLSASTSSSSVIASRSSASSLSTSSLSLSSASSSSSSTPSSIVESRSSASSKSTESSASLSSESTESLTSEG